MSLVALAKSLWRTASNGAQKSFLYNLNTGMTTILRPCSLSPITCPPRIRKFLACLPRTEAKHSYLD